MIRFFSETNLRRARILSGLIIFAFVFSHLFNHSLALISIDTAERAAARRAWNRPVLWPLGLGLLLLVLAIVPATLGYRRRERRAALK